MNPYLQHHLADNRVADMHSHAERQRIARAARRGNAASRRRCQPQKLVGPRNAPKRHLIGVSERCFCQCPAAGKRRTSRRPSQPHSPGSDARRLDDDNQRGRPTHGVLAGRFGGLAASASSPEMSRWRAAR